MASAVMIDLGPTTSVAAQPGGGCPANGRGGAFKDVLRVKAESISVERAGGATVGARCGEVDRDCGAQVETGAKSAGQEQDVKLPATGRAGDKVAQTSGKADAAEDAVTNSGAADSGQDLSGGEAIRHVAEDVKSGERNAIAPERGRTDEVKVRRRRNGKSTAEGEKDDVGERDLAGANDVPVVKTPGAYAVEVVPVAVMVATPQENLQVGGPSEGERGRTPEDSGPRTGDIGASMAEKGGSVPSALPKMQEFGTGKLTAEGAEGRRGKSGASRLSHLRENIAADAVDVLRPKQTPVDFVAERDENAAVSGDQKPAIPSVMKSDTPEKEQIAAGAAALKVEAAPHATKAVSASETNATVVIEAPAIDPAAIKEAVRGAVKDSAIATSDSATAHAPVANVSEPKTTVASHTNATRNSGAVEKRAKAASPVAAGGIDGDRQRSGSESAGRTPDAIIPTGSADVKQSAGHANAAVGITSATAAISGAAPADRSSLPTSAAGHGEVRSETPLPTATMPVNVTAIAARAAEALRHGEVRLGWDSEQLGRVDIKATVHGQEVAAAVKVESDAGRQWMTSELPKLADALGRQDFTVRSLQVMDFSASDGQRQGGGNAQQQRWSQRAGASGAERQGSERLELNALDEESQHGLSIHV